MVRVIRPIGIVAVLLVAALPYGSGQSEPAAPPTTVTVPDGSSDVTMQAARGLGGPSQNASERFGSNYDHLDILKVVFGQETGSAFTIELYLKALGSGTGPGAPSRSVSFAVGRHNWRVLHGNCGGASATMACLQFQDNGRGQFRTVKRFAADVQADRKVIAFTLDKQDIYNENRVTLRYGDVLGNLTASTSQSHIGGGFGPMGGGGGGPAGGGDGASLIAWDRAPNVGFGMGFPLQKGSHNRGYLELFAADPIRVSNGEATTIVFKVILTNKAASLVSTQLEAVDVPKDWSVRVPALLNVPAKSNLTFPVILAMPFTHDHGKTVTFKLVAQAAEDRNSGADLDLGVFWTDVPQPSGHHEGKLWFHSAPSESPQLPDALEPYLPTVAAWMNGIEKDPDPLATDENVPGVSAPPPGPGQGGGGGGGTGFVTNWNVTWYFPLGPALEMGLDFDLTRAAAFQFALMPKVASTQARITARVHYCDPPPPQPQGGGGGGGGQGGFQQTCGPWSPIIAQAQTTSSLSANTEFAGDYQMPISGRYDLVPFKHGANIGVSVSVVTEVPQNVFGTLPRPEFVAKKSLLTLPLLEYHDPIDQAFQNVGSLSLVATSPFEKLVNPGETSVFNFDLTSGADALRQRVSLEVQGINFQWARILGPDVFDMQPGETRNLTLAVEAPSDGQPEERAELFLVAQSLKDFSVVTAVRLRATVVTDQDIPDEDEAARAAEGSADTAAPGLVWALFSLSLLVVVMQRRRP